MTKATLSLIDKFDDRIEVDGKVLTIDMRLDTVMRFVALLDDERVPHRIKLKKALYLMLDEDLSNLNVRVQMQVLNALVEHVASENDNKIYDLKGNVIPTPFKEQVTDYVQDFDYIYAGFLQTYNIDLLENRFMDWRKFLALLKSLPKNTKYREVIEIRTMDTKGYKGEDLVKIREAQNSVSLKKKGGKK